MGMADLWAAENVPYLITEIDVAGKLAANTITAAFASGSC